MQRPAREPERINRMYEKLSNRVERVIELARGIAREYGLDYLGTEHTLLAIQQEGTGLGAKLLDGFGIDEYRLKAAVDKRTRNSMEETWVLGRLPGSPSLKSVVAYAIELAQQLESKEVCTEHLLLGMLKEEGSVAEQALGDLGLRYDDARARLVEMTSTS